MIERLLLAAWLVAWLAGCNDEGQPCTRGRNGVDDCAFGFSCTAQDEGGHGVCVCSDVDEDLEVGERCESLTVTCHACRGRAVCNRGSGRCTLPGTVPEGGACGDDVECVAGTICNGALERCEPPGAHAAGERCGATRECMAGLVCGSPDKRNVCAEPAGEGESCKPGWCGPGFVCGAPLDPERCQPLGDIGSLCRETAHCRAGLICNGWFHPAQCGTGTWLEPCLDSSDCAAPLTCSWVHKCGN